VEKVLKLVQGYYSSSDAELKKCLDWLFRVQTSSDMLVSTPSLTFREFEQANVPLRELGEWVQTVLRIFTDPLPRQLLAMDKRYSSHILNSDIIDKFKVSEAQCVNLRAVFSHKAMISMKNQPSLGKQELSLDTWIILVKEFLPSSLATMIFLVSATSFKAIWRLEEFVEFCFTFGRCSVDDQASHLIRTCYRYFLRLSKSSDEKKASAIGTLKTFFRRIVLFLAQSSSNFYGSGADSPKNTANGEAPDKAGPTTDDVAMVSVSLVTLSRHSLGTLEELQSKVFLPAVISEALDTIDSQATDPPLQFYIDLLSTYHTYLPGMRELEMAASCLFGVQPVEPSKEKEFIMELMVKRQSQAPQNRAQPYGPVGTEWCVIVHSWWDNWRFYVGHKRIAIANTSSLPVNAPASGGGLTHSSSNNNLNSSASLLPPKHPGEIDNWSVLKKSGPKQLLQGTTLHHSIEIIPPSVYHALQMWYGGGPRIQRKVIYTTIGNIKSAELELFPLCIKICTCLPDGRAREADREMLVSRMQKVSQIVSDLSDSRNIDPNRVRLWNYAQQHWKDQHVLNPELTLEEANLQDGQILLLEVSLNDGTWPRSQLHSQLDEEERMRQQAAGDSQKKSTAAVITKQPIGDADVVKAVNKLNDGRIGLDNLGNTCYLNASLQALLHTEPLVEYFMSQSYLRDINSSSKFGYGGRLAMSFGKLVEELYRSNRRSISPRHFINDLAAIRQQFSGNQQHDAQELLAFLLDGLSEDLNLVNEKPYTVGSFILKLDSPASDVITHCRSNPIVMVAQIPSSPIFGGRIISNAIYR
jgi:hypothetical protein